MRLITPILGGSALLMAALACATYFINAEQANRGTTVGYFMGAAVVFAVLAFASTFINKRSQGIDAQTNANKNVRKVALIIIVPVLLFVAIIYLAAWYF
jgi:hypothetical protein